MTQTVGIEDGADALLELIARGNDVEVLEADDGWELLVALAEGALEDAIGDLAEGGGRVVALARRSGMGIPFVLLARVTTAPAYDEDDVYYELGDGD